MRIFRLLASHPIFLFKLNKSGFGECYQSAIKWEIWKSKSQCFQGFAGPHIHFLLIPTRSRQKFSKRICLWDLVQGIGIISIIQIVEAIWFFVSNAINRDLTSAINLLSNGDLKNQKVSIFKGLRALISTFCLFPLGKFRYSRVYLRWFRRKNFRKYVNIPPAIFGCKVY